VFSTAARMKARMSPGSGKPFEVFTVAATVRPIRARGGLSVRSDHDFPSDQPIDLFTVFAGMVSADSVHGPEFGRRVRPALRPGRPSGLRGTAAPSHDGILMHRSCGTT
jgi:hypothetical protein